MERGTGSMTRLQIDALGNCLNCGKKLETTSASCCPCQNWDIKVLYPGVEVWTQKLVNASEIVEVGEIV